MTRTQVRPGPVLLLGGAAAVVLFLIYQFFLKPLQAYNSQLAALERDIADKRGEANAIRKEKPLLERWRQQSLPADRYAAELEYDRYLGDLLYRSKLTVLDLHSVTTAAIVGTGPGAAKKSVFTPLLLSVDAQGNLKQLGEMLRRFQQTPLVHKIRSLRIESEAQGPKGQKGGRLKVHMLVEALILDKAPKEQPNLIGAEARLLELDLLDGLRRGPAFLGLLSQAGPPRRNYVLLNRKNIFTGPQPFTPDSDIPNVAQFVYLTKITEEGDGPVAVLLNRYNNFEKTVLHAVTSANSFTINDGGGEELLKGEVLKIEPRDVYFQVGRRIYELHIGQSLSQAMRQPVDFRKLRALGLGKKDNRPSGFDFD
jgi:hypothetical protein